MLSRALIWLSGYPWDLTDQVSASQDRSRLRKNGAGVAVSATVASLTFGITTLWATGESAPLSQWLWFLVAALAGMVIVVAFDRAVLFASDVTSRRTWQHRLRWPLIFVMAGLAALKLVSFVLIDDMRNVAAQEQEARAFARASQISASINPAGMGERASAAASDVARLREQSISVPATIEARLSAADLCQRGVERRRRTLLAQGLTPRQAGNQTLEAARGCADQRRAAQLALSQYREGISADLARAREELARRDAAAERTDREANSLRERGNLADSQNLTPDSLTVVARLLLTNPIADVWLIVMWAIFVLADGMGMMTSGVCGRTGFGSRLESEHDADVAAAEEARARSAGKIDEAWFVHEAICAGARSADGQTACHSAGARHMAQAAGVFACAQTVERMTDGAVRINEAKRRVAKIAPSMGDLFDDLLAAEIKRTRFGTFTTAGECQ